jgi:predicted transcriptional regulator with HTH domain
MVHSYNAVVGRKLKQDPYNTRITLHGLSVRKSCANGQRKENIPEKDASVEINGFLYYVYSATLVTCLNELSCGANEI